MNQSPQPAFEGDELYILADCLLSRINTDKKHLEAWKELKSNPNTHLKEEEIISGIELYFRLVNENIALRHKILKALLQDPNPEFIEKEAQS